MVTTSFGQSWKKGSITGEGPTVKEEITLNAFEGIGLGVPGKVYVYKGSQKVVIEAQKNIIDNIKRNVSGGSWDIEFDKKVRDFKDITIYITLPAVDELAVAGSGEIIGKDAFQGLGDLEMSIGGSGKIEFAGSAKDVEISIAGSGDVDASELSTQSCEVSIAGSGDCSVGVDEKLDVSIAGSGDVRYSGNPRVSSSIAGSGSVKSFSN